jgi:hypothetical protein
MNWEAYTLTARERVGSSQEISSRNAAIKKGQV